MRVVCVVCVWPWVWLALVAAAHAEPRTLAGLAWQAPVTCPDAADVRARIERRLGMPIERAVHGVEVEIATDGDGKRRRFVARIDLRGVTLANEVRVLTSARCDELTDAVAVVIARIAAENRQSPVARLGAVAHAATTDPPRDAAPGFTPGLRALGISGIGALPGVGIGGELAGYIRARTLAVELAVARWVPGHRVMQPGAARQIEVSLDMVAVRIGWRSEELPLRAWIAGELGAVEGKGIALSATGRWTGVGAGFAVAWSIAPYARLVGIIEVVAPLDRARFLVNDGHELYRPGPVTVRSGLGLEIGWR